MAGLMVNKSMNTTTKAVYLLNRLFNCDDCAVIEDRVYFDNGAVTVAPDIKDSNGFNFHVLEV